MSETISKRASVKKDSEMSTAVEEAPKRRVGRPRKVQSEKASSEKEQSVKTAAGKAAHKEAPSGNESFEKQACSSKNTAGSEAKTPEAKVEAKEEKASKKTSVKRRARAKASEEPLEKTAASAQEADGEAKAGSDEEITEPVTSSVTIRKTRSRKLKTAAEPEAEPKEETPNDASAETTVVRRTNRERTEKAAETRSTGKHQGGLRRARQHTQNREVLPTLSLEDLSLLKVAELRTKAEELGLEVAGMKKAELVEAVFAAAAHAEGFREVQGILDIMSDGYGFLRVDGYLPSEKDCYVGLSLIRRTGLRKGDYLVGQTRPTRQNEKYPAIQKVISVNDIPVEQLKNRVNFGDLTPVYPDECLVMEHGKNALTARVIDLVSPIGKGQRGLIVSPPKAGKTTILKDIAAAISANNPEVHLMCLLVDERPEEVTDMRRSIKGEVVSSTFDMPTENHIQVAELVIERAKRLVECGRDVVILLDSITRLARAYNLAQPASGRVLSGGVDSTALYPPKHFLGAARNIENGGSLTILASALIDTGSKMDEVIFEEFKGTGNMELRLDRFLADRRIFPAIDPVISGTRKEELLLNAQEAPLIWAVRRILANMNNTERAMDMLIKSLKQTDTNQEFLIRTAKKAQHAKNDGITEF